MESFDSSPNYMRVTSSFDAKKENSPQGGSECDDIISVSSSTCGSSVNGPYAQKLNNNGIKYRASNKKILKNFGNVRSFRRRAKSRVIHSPIPISDEDSLVDSSQSSPHYLKATTCSERKKTHSQASPRHSESPFDGSDRNSSHPKLASPSHKSLQTLSRTSSLRSVRILIKKTSFKPKRSSLNYSKVSEDVTVDRATYSSTLKDTKFPQPVELHSGGIESEKSSAVRVCRYHHCSLHGHCRGSHDPDPPPKRFLYKRRRSLKKQKSIIPKTESRFEGKNSSDKKRNLQKSQRVPIVERLNEERISDSITSSCDENKNDVETHEENFYNQGADQLFGDGYKDIQEAYLVEVAFGETSFPERSYQENLNILRRYSSQEQDFGGTSFGRNGYCLRCSCGHNGEEVSSTPRRAEAGLSLHKVTSSSVNNNEIPKNGFADFFGTSSSALFKKPDEASSKDCPQTPVVFDEVNKKNSAFSSPPYSQTSSDSNSEEEVEFTTESTTTGDSKVNEVVQVEDSEMNSPVQKGSKLQFSKPRHISMWHLIHQHMSSNLAAEPTNKSVQGADAGSPVDGANSLLAKESTTSSRDLPDSDMGRINNDSETQEIELRKLFAIKLVREAIEKILLPEVQDQTSDDWSVTSESTPHPELMEKNQRKESDAERGEANSSPNLKEESVITDDASSREIREAGKQVVRKSEKKAPKHWSNLKKWILLQRFIRELEKVRKFNPRKPQHLPLNPDPEAEKVNLRPQTVDERKSAEEWMLDYALRQAVSQLAPTQKRKVSLLVKAFETVVPSQEDSQAQFRIPRLRDNGLDVASDNSVPTLDSADQETGIKMTKETEKVYDVKDNYAESSVKFQSSNDIRIGELTSNEKSVFLSRSCTCMDDVPDSKEANPIETAGDNLDLQGIHKDTVEVGNIAENDTEKRSMPTFRGLQGDAISDYIDEKAKDSGQSSQMDRKNYIKTWHMIYQHVVSGIAQKVGSQLLDGSEDDEVEENSNSNDFSQPIDESSKENRVSSNLRGGLTKSDALNLVKEALDEILLPEIQDDSSDTQSVTSEDISERNCNEIGGKISSEGRNLMSEEGKDTKAESQVIKKYELPKPKNWSKLKKLILLKRSIKALQKARKFKPQPHQSFPQTPDPEPEKIDLRRQMMDERKKAEQWMLDYTVQHIVTKLTPARKRRVSMLVEAFEAVVPLPEI